LPVQSLSNIEVGDYVGWSSMHNATAPLQCVRPAPTYLADRLNVPVPDMFLQGYKSSLRQAFERATANRWQSARVEMSLVPLLFHIKNDDSRGVADTPCESLCASPDG
jgi:hypothetical protein